MRLKELVIRDFGLKLLSFAFAVLIYVTVSTAIKREINLAADTLTIAESRIFPELPVLVVSSAADVRQFKVRPSYVEVEVRGAPGVISKLAEKDVRVLVDLTDIKWAVGLRKRVEVSTPPGVMHVRVTPPEVEIVMPAKTE
ncbi:MAG: hypothetical protein N2379_02340 [Verrucomicrobiae bacterium]|nr:hypothetical protein [Verrucomicrobiae bacterium]